MTDPVTATVSTTTPAPTTSGGGGNILSDITNAPMQFVQGLLGAPLSGLAGLGKGVFSNTVGNIFGVVKTGALITLAAKFLPDLVMWLPLKINGKKVGEIMAEEARDKGTPGILKLAALSGLVVNAVVGGLKGALGGAMGSNSGEKGLARKTGGVLGTVATVVGLGALVFSAVGDTKIGFAGSDDHSTPKTPDNTPKTPASTTPSKTVGN